jgi:outer membrane biosynthesis protein TonB
MSSLGDDVRRCYIIGQSPDEGGKVVVEVAIAQDGAVRAARIIQSPGGKAEAASCAEKALKKASFSTFCGDDVSLRWTYTLRPG